MLKNAQPHISFVILAVIGLVGLFGESAILHNSLVHSYPYKMMNTPPAEFYASVGDWGYYVSAVGGVTGLALSIRLKRYLTAVVPVVLGPLCYWLTFEIAHFVWQFSREEMSGRNFDGYTGYTARYEFGYNAFLLMFIGTVIAVVAGLLITRISKPAPVDLA